MFYGNAFSLVRFVGYPLRLHLITNTKLCLYGTCKLMMLPLVFPSTREGGCLDFTMEIYAEEGGDLRRGGGGVIYADVSLKEINEVSLI